MSEEPVYYGDRGFAAMPSVADRDGGTVTVQESSNAMEPCIWLRLENGGGSASAELTLEAAGQLRNRLDWLIENHYQVRDE